MVVSKKTCIYANSRFYHNLTTLFECICSNLNHFLIIITINTICTVLNWTLAVSAYLIFFVSFLYFCPKRFRFWIFSAEIFLWCPQEMYINWQYICLSQTNIDRFYFILMDFLYLPWQKVKPYLSSEKVKFKTFMPLSLIPDQLAHLVFSLRRKKRVIFLFFYEQ